jgi:anti-sigma factor RsiW
VTDCEGLRQEIGGYVLGALEPAEMAAVRAHLGQCVPCSREHASLSGLPALLTLAEGLDAAAGPPPAVEERLLDRIASSQPRPRRARPLGWRRGFWRRRSLALTAVGLACAAVGAGVTAVLLPGGDSADPEAYGYEVLLQGTPASPGARARAALESVPSGTNVILWVRGLPRNSDAVYEVRCEGRDWSASAGTFRADRSGRASITLTTAARQGDYDRIRVVRHGWDAAAQRVTETSVMSGKLS